MRGRVTKRKGMGEREKERKGRGEAGRETTLFHVLVHSLNVLNGLG